MLPYLSLQPPLRPRITRPRGLWKGGKSKQRFNLDGFRSKSLGSDTSSDDDLDGYCLLEYSPEPFDNDCCSMDTSEPPTAPDSRFEEWEALKDLFARAAEKYESDDVNEAVALLRSVIAESARFLVLYEDPSLLFAEPGSKTPEPVSMTSPKTPKKKCTCRENPTALHAQLGTALFLFGNLIAQDPSLALPNEPSIPATYWLAALDVFETGENLPSRTSGRGCDAPEDWRMAIVWGRTLICVADAALTLQLQSSSAPPPPPERKWQSPTASPFAAIAMRRPPASRRIVLATADMHELLVLAIDHFARGIFHMPRTAPRTEPGPSSAPTFDRSSELFTIAREALALAERLPAAAERTRWATWADSVLQQIPVQTEAVIRVRGRCWLVVGTARVEEIEASAWGDSESSDSPPSSSLDSEEAEEAREGLERAIEFFERAMSEGLQGTDVAESERGSEDELRAFLIEALLTLANLTKDKDSQEALYQRAQLLGGDTLGMEMDMSS
ncbi:hypothetical protein R3P38DRAFT_3352694 [Favolaschia claudopus]|uniref:Uncharacterized protein n=1 Tax=Favolaschia claudopus TaxID=2862362 RepID=A0AAW0BZT1_9AGAR